MGSAPAVTRSSGFAALDAQLPGQGWPCQGLTELLCPEPGTLAWRLLAPLLRSLTLPQSATDQPPGAALPARRRLSARGAARTSAALPVVLVGPPHRPHPPGFRADGIDERAMVWLQAETMAERLWATEQVLKARAPGVLMAWLPQARPEQLRRLQVLASAGQGLVFVCRPLAAASEASAAPLRLRVVLGPGWSLQVDLLKRPGPPLAHSLSLPSVPGGLAGLLPLRLRRADAVVPLAPAPTREEDHVVVRPVAARAAAWH